jgi:hypothetical protein
MVPKCNRHEPCLVMADIIGELIAKKAIKSPMTVRVSGNLNQGECPEKGKLLGGKLSR